MNKLRRKKKLKILLLLMKKKIKFKPKKFKNNQLTNRINKSMQAAIKM